MTNIRRATTEDLPRMEAAAHAFYGSSKHLQRFDIQKFAALWAKFFELNFGAIWIVEGDGEIQGALGALCMPDGYSNDVIAEERFWFIKPGFRGSGVRLYYLFQQWAKERGATQIHMCHLCDLMPNKLERFYESEGYELMEKRYGKKVA